MVSFADNQYTDNKYFLHGQETLEKLQNRKEEDFMSDDISYAVKALERIYKGVLTSMQDYSDYIIPYNKFRKANLVESTHNLYKLRHEIQRNLPEMFDELPKSKYIELKTLLQEFSHMYKDASYDKFFHFSDLQRIMRFAEQEVRQISAYYEKENPYDMDEDEEER